jgi:DNA-binding YbaB/EbfC family protein
VFEGLSNLAHIGALFKQAQQMGSKMQQVTEELKTRRAEGSAGGGMVTVEVNGIGEVLSCHIDPSLITSGDRELIEDLLPAAVNAALAKGKELYAQAMQSMTDGLDVPGLNAMLAQLSGGKPDKPAS